MIATLLDTNAAIALLGGRSAPLMKRLAMSPEGSVAVSAIVAYELWLGAMKSTRVALNSQRLDLFFGDVAILPFEAEDARVAGAIRADLERAGCPIGPYDLLIAGQALARGLTLVTHNVREFARVAGLVVEDWATEPGSLV
ncbi:type II toxin-antitoxin system VapC family toxin [Jiella marina]|uniref:type II toxin-antitoxin system VapC family toxin n=1 Tax=Jiella sp. LLJ827 TaxID=2917712 RepID=UPI0021009BAA|nr:type II toxin-antitoxin system VapC family toxin [Jiella sp. LLJ827]